MDQNTYVVLEFNPRNFYNIVQALGRDAKQIEQSCKGTIILSQLEYKHQIPAANIMSYYQKMVAEEDTQEQLKMGLLIVGHIKEMRFSQQNASMLVSILKESLRLFYKEDDLDETA